MNREELIQAWAQIMYEQDWPGSWSKLKPEFQGKYLQIAELLLDLKQTCNGTGRKDSRELLTKRVEELEQALDDDASDLWDVTNAIRKEIQSRQWITDGRGSYEWNDDRYREEAKHAFDAILKLIANVQHPAQKRFHQTILKTKAKQRNPRGTGEMNDGEQERTSSGILGTEEITDEG